MVLFLFYSVQLLRLRIFKCRAKQGSALATLEREPDGGPTRNNTTSRPCNISLSNNCCIALAALPPDNYTFLRTDVAWLLVFLSEEIVIYLVRGPVEGIGRLSCLTPCRKIPAAVFPIIWLARTFSTLSTSTAVNHLSLTHLLTHIRQNNPATRVRVSETGLLLWPDAAKLNVCVVN